MVKNLPESRRILDQPTHPKFAPPCQAVLFQATLHLPVTLKSDIGQLRTACLPQSPPEFLKLADPKRAHPRLTHSFPRKPP